MKKKLTDFYKLMLLPMALGSSFTAWSQTPVPVKLSGFNQDVIVSGTGAANALSTYDVDGTGAGYNFMSADYVNPSGAINTTSHPLPNSGGTVTSVATTTPTLTFTMGNYSANNVLRVPATGTGTGTNTGPDAGSISFVPSVAATTVYVLATGGGASVTSGMNVTATFSDGTTQALATNATLGDWFTGTANAIAYQGFGRVSRSAASGLDLASATTPRLYQLVYTITNTTKPISSLTFGKSVTAGVINVFAVSIVPTAGVADCNSAPAPGTANASASYTNSGSYTTLSLTGASTSPGLSYKWQYSSDNATWTDLPTYPSGSAAAPTSPYSQNPNAVTCVVTNLIADNYFQCLVTCANDGAGGAAYPSTSVLVHSLPAYCAPTSTATNEYITNVTLGSINSSTTNQSSTAPVDFTLSPTATTTTTLSLGGTYNISVSARDNSSVSSAAVWIDYNHNGTFEASEFLLIGSGPAVNTPQYYSPQLLTVSSALTIPATALLGATKMRVRWKNGLATSGEACTTYSGETEDYRVTIVAATPCTGAAVTATGAPSAICPNVAFSIAATGATSTSGVSYQWQSSPAGLGTFTNINTTTFPSAATQTLVVSQTAATDYQVVASCGGSPTTSSPVTVGLTPFANCYCTPSAAVVPTPAPVVAGSPTSYLASTSGCGTYGAITAAVVFTNASVVAATTTAAPGCSATSPYYTNNTATNIGTLTALVPYTVTGTIAKNTRLVAWIDYDHSGTFDASEAGLVTVNSTAAAATFTATLTLPITVLTGDTRIRFRTEQNTGTVLTNNGNSCLITAVGQTQDYTVTLAPATACSTVPAITAAMTTPASGTVCPAVSVTLTASGMPTGTTGLTYQWQSSTTGTAGTFSPITGATAATYTFTQLATTYYNVVVTCAAGSSSATSTTVTVTESAIASCYCTPSSSSVGEYFTNVTVGSLNNTSGSSTTTTPSGFADYTGNPALTTALSPTNTYTISVTAVDGRINSQALLWIDYNQDGVYDSSTEYTLVGSGPTSGSFPQTLSFTKPFTVPSTALPGQTHMRLRWHNDNNSTDACATGWNGETEEYLITIVPLVPCTGTPPAIAATSTVANACANVAFTLTATGPAITTSGLSYQWMSSPAGANTFAPLGAAQATASYTVTNQTAATDYQVVVTCTSSTLSSTSNTVPVGQNGYAACYCIPANTACGSYVLFPMSIAPVGSITPVFATTSKLACASAAPYFIDNTATGSNPTGSLNIGGTYTFSGGLTPGSRASMWIDYDHSGTFDASEWTQLSGGTSTSYNFPYSNSFTVAATALAGPTRMRVRTDIYSSTVLGSGANACVAAANGQTVDYTVTLVATPACVAGTVFQAVASTGFVSSVATSGRAVTLSVSDIPAGTTGLTYQWQSRLNTAGNTNTFADVTGATNATYAVTDQAATTDYQVTIKCGGQPTASNPVTVYNSIEGTIGSVLSNPGGEFLSDFGMLNDVNGGGFDNSTGAIRSTSPTGFTDYTGNPTLTATLNRGVLYTGTQVAGFLNSSGTFTGMWIDANQNGTFEGSEYTYLGSGAAASGAPATFPGSTAPVTGQTNPNPISITLPAASIVGKTRVRVRWRNSGITANTDATVGSYSATSGSNWYGSTEDYMITVQDPGLCTAPPDPVTAAPSQPNACSNATITLNATNIPATLSGYTYQWQSRTGTDAFANVTAGIGGTTQSYTLTQTVPTDYQVIVGCQYGGLAVTSNIVSVGQNTFDLCYANCATTHSPGCDTGGGTITNVTLNTLNNTTTCPSTSSFLTVFPASGTTTTTLTMGSTYTLSVSNSSNPTVGGGYYYGVWIDYNHSATFDASEFVPNNANATTATTATTTTVSITIPLASSTVLSGPTRMRIASDNAGSAFYGPFNAGDGCATGRIGGETEDYTLTIAATPLPIELTRFAAEAVGTAAVNLAWATASEKNSARFEVERSLTGVGFVSIGTVAAAGSSSVARTYGLVDDALPAGAKQLYYRLRQVDQDGTAAYSPVRVVQLSKPASLELYPNPARSAVTVTGALAGASIQVFDALGRPVVTIAADASGTGRLTLPVHLPSGVYVVRSGSQVRRLTVE